MQHVTQMISKSQVQASCKTILLNRANSVDLLLLLSPVQHRYLFSTPLRWGSDIYRQGRL